MVLAMIAFGAALGGFLYGYDLGLIVSRRAAPGPIAPPAPPPPWRARPQHCGNHGAMSTKAWVNEAMGAMDDGDKRPKCGGECVP